jgi:methionine aminopeptidase
MDPLNEALKDATLAVLLGSTVVPQQFTDQMGNITHFGTVTIPSAFESRIREKARTGEFDDLIAKAMEKITPEDVLGVIKNAIAEKFLEGLEPVQDRYGGGHHANWLQDKAKSIAIEAATAALSADEGLLDTLRSRIGAEVDRNRVEISVRLSDPEKG